MEAGLCGYGSGFGGRRCRLACLPVWGRLDENGQTFAAFGLMELKLALLSI